MKLVIFVVFIIGVNAHIYADREKSERCYKRISENAQKRNRSSLEFDIRTDALPQECLPGGRQPRSCEEIYSYTQLPGIYNIFLSEYSKNPIQLECNRTWAVIQRRKDGSVDFYRDWVDYKYGFGINGEEFFIGLDNLHALTNANKMQLAIFMETDEESKVAFYTHFVIGNESEGYAIKSLGLFYGNAGDSLTHHLSSKFTTRDRDNDEDDRNCAVEYTGAWWYKKCHLSNLNGVYGDDSYGKGINWFDFTGHEKSLSKVTMMIGL